MGGSSAPALFYLDEPAAKDLYATTFSRHAGAYKRRLDEVMARGEAHGRDAVIAWVDPGPGKRILDLACGPGTLSYPIAKSVSPGGEVVGIDLAPGMIELARRHAPPGLPLRFELMDTEDLRFPDHTFDAAVCGHGFQFAPNLQRALVEARRVLEPGGRMAASVPVDPVRLSDAQVILERAIGGALPPAPKARDQLITRGIVEDAEAFVAVAMQAGFSAAEIVRYEESTTWASPRHFIDMSAGWWSMAIRLERLASGERASLLDRATRAIEAELGSGSLRIAGATGVLLAVA
jgi:ubiquinone/menaquinone biosynthesis C-methylase UbiE